MLIDIPCHGLNMRLYQMHDGVTAVVCNDAGLAVAQETCAVNFFYTRDKAAKSAAWRAFREYVGLAALGAIVGTVRQVKPC